MLCGGAVVREGCRFNSPGAFLCGICTLHLVCKCVMNGCLSLHVSPVICSWPTQVYPTLHPLTAGIDSSPPWPQKASVKMMDSASLTTHFWVEIPSYSLSNCTQSGILFVTCFTLLSMLRGTFMCYQWRWMLFVVQAALISTMWRRSLHQLQLWSCPVVLYSVSFTLQLRQKGRIRQGHRQTEGEREHPKQNEAHSFALWMSLSLTFSPSNHNNSVSEVYNHHLWKQKSNVLQKAVSCYILWGVQHTPLF